MSSSPVPPAGRHLLAAREAVAELRALSADLPQVLAVGLVPAPGGYSVQVIARAAVELPEQVGGVPVRVHTPLPGRVSV